MEIIGGLLAGLGMFFVGIKMLTENLRQLTGRRFRRMLERSTRNPLLSALGGALLGATMQTGSTITFILVGMVGAGMISVERSLPVRLGAAVGTSTMVFFATLDIKLFLLFLLGVAGIALAQIRSPRPVLGVLFGGGLMFFGLQMVGTTASSLTQLAWLQTAILSVNDAPLTAFILGAILSLLIQSPQSVAILAIAMTTSGVLSPWTTMVIIYGSNFGGGVSTYLLSSGFRGTSRQIMIFQVLFNVLTGIVLLSLYYVERGTGFPLVYAMVTSIGTDVARQMAFVYLIFNVFGAVMMFTFRVPILRWIEQRWPPTPEEDMGKLGYLHDHALDAPDLALDLAEKEEKRFFSLLSRQVDALRLPSGQDEKQGETLTSTLHQLHESIEEVLGDLGQLVGVDGSEQLIKLVNRNRLLGTLHSSMVDFTSAVRSAKKGPNLEGFAGMVIEAFDALLAAAIDSYENGDPEELLEVWRMTDDRSDQMRAVRKRFMRGEAPLSEAERLDLMSLTNGLERTVWVLHEFIGASISSDPYQQPDESAA